MSDLSISQLRVILERGDGQRVDVGDFPDLKSPLGVARFLCKLADACERCGKYIYPSPGWVPESLELGDE